MRNLKGWKKRCKGSVTESPQTVLAVIIFASVTVAVILFFRAYYIDYAAIMKTPSDKLKSVEIANAIKSCFQEGKLYVTREFLEAQKGKKIEDICGISGVDINAYLKDIETGQQWLFTSYVGHPDHEIWIPIAYSEFEEMRNVGQKIPAGEYVIYVKWYGVGTGDIRANDILIALYPSVLYPANIEGIRSVNYTSLMAWINNLKDDKEEGTGKIIIPEDGTFASYFIPSRFRLTTCSEVGNVLRNEACVKIFKGVNEIHLGRLYVDVEA